MIFLRLASLVAGVLVLIAPAILIRVGGMPPDTGRAGAALACVVLASSGFIMIGMAGQRLRSALLRTAAAILLGVPTVASAALLWRGSSPAVLWLAGAVIGLSVLLYLKLVYRPAPLLAALLQRRRRHPAPGP
ncbi:hypothetical protein [Massilia timonae]|uniref:Uncharacterized protein n=1 Tax=Massilia timonae CCUG 45783 TaxID=883126 RepID=K9DAP3_9BURK|nr:hypothetical protein [Massilia timonae]EKU81278.1 hypothetical protein HMPREF9710_03118 [Massilia timonae CCUG 45783]HAB63369.1 hypothetical protein [Pseudomonas sp.]